MPPASSVHVHVTAARPEPASLSPPQKSRMSLLPGYCEFLAHVQLRAHAAHDDGVLAEAHAAELAIESIGLERAQRLGAIERPALLVCGGDRAAGAGLHDAQRHVLGRQLVDTILVI